MNFDLDWDLEVINFVFRPRRQRLCPALSILLLGSALAQDHRREESEDYFKKWLKTDVRYIISDEEKEIFLALSNEEEKERFIEAFWKRRDPTPGTLENEFKEEHYRRIAYANDRFSAGLAGWLTDRGKIYIKFGPPDQTDVYPTGTQLQDIRGGILQAIEQGARGGVTPRQVTTFPFEVWNYRYLEGIGSDITIEFVDRTGSGLYTLARDPEEKNVFAYKDPAADLASINRSDLLRPSKDRQFYRNELLAKVNAPPPVKFKELQEVVSTRVSYDDLAFKAVSSVLQVTENSYFVPVVFSLPATHLQFQPNGEVRAAKVNVFLQATNLQKQIAALFEDTLELKGPEADLEKLRNGTALYEKKLLLAPGRYVVDLVLRDENSSSLGTWQQLVVVPERSEGLALSSLILADVLRPLEAGESASDAFAIGSHKVVPNVSGVFSKDKKAGLFFQIYGFAIDQARLQPNLELDVTFKQDAFNFEIHDDLSRFGKLEGDRATVRMSVPLTRFPTGKIEVSARVKDLTTGQSAEGKTSFEVGDQ